jgi:hypothetical protein
MASSLVGDAPVIIQNVEPVAAEAVERVPIFDVKSTKKGIHLFGMVDRDTALEIVERATAVPEKAEATVLPSIKPVGEIEAPGDEPDADNAFAALVTGTQPERCSTRKITEMEQMIREDQNTLQVIYNRIFGTGATPEDSLEKTPIAHRPPVQAGVILPKTNLFRSIRNTNVEDLEGCIAPADLKN